MSKPSREDVLKVAGEPAYWMTNESQWRLSNGESRKGAVPVHSKRSSTAIVPLYTESQLLAMYAAGAEDMRERAAKECECGSREAMGAQYGKPDDLCNVILGHHAVAHTNDAAAIRALPINTEGEQGGNKDAE